MGFVEFIHDRDSTQVTFEIKGSSKHHRPRKSFTKIIIRRHPLNNFPNTTRMKGSKPIAMILAGLLLVSISLPSIDVLALRTLELKQQQQETADGDSTLTPDEIAFLDSLDHLENDDVEAAYAVLQSSFESSARNADPSKRFNRLSQRKISLGGGTTFTSEYKIRQDIEQAQYLAETLYQEGGDPAKAEFFETVVLPVYQKLLSRIPPLEELNETMGLYKFQRSDVDYGIMNFYNRALRKFYL